MTTSEDRTLSTDRQGAASPASASGPRRWLLWGVLVLVLSAITVAAILSRLGPAGPELPILGEVPPFELTSHRGETITLEDLEGAPWVADFIFTRCALSCPMMTTRMAELDEALPAGTPPAARLVSISVDPEHDRPEVLADYAEAFGASERWHFLTGTEAEILELAIRGFKLGVNPDPPPEMVDPDEPILHSTRFVLVDGEGRIRGYYDGMSADGVQELERDVVTLE